MRIVLGICLVAGCTLLGRSMGNALRRRVGVLDSLIHGIKMLRIHMSGMLETVEAALNMTDCQAMIAVAGEMSGGLSARESWQNVKTRLCRRGGSLDALCMHDMEVLDGLFQNLGENGRQAQEIQFQSTMKLLQEQREGAKAQLSERERLYVTVGFLMGLMLALVVI